MTLSVGGDARPEDSDTRADYLAVPYVNRAGRYIDSC
jgi:hypothetical protein